jgi:hypothetical protein
MTDQGYELSWDSPIENDGSEFIVLPEGKYRFKVIDFERARFAGSDKLPPCNQAIVHLQFTGKDKDSGREGTIIIKHNLYLHSSTEWALCAFFVAIGQRKHGEKILMNWNKVIGSEGDADLFIDKWKNKEGKELENNKVKKFLNPVETKNFTFGTF